MNRTININTAILDSVKIKTPSDIGVNELEKILAHYGYLNGSKISAVQATDLYIQGRNSRTARFSIEYLFNDEGAPRSLIAKIFSDNSSAEEMSESSKETIARYYREVNFFESAAAGCGIRVPQYLGSLLDSAAQLYIILLEDMGDSSLSQFPPAQLLTNLDFVVRDLADFHARWYRKDLGSLYPWLQGERHMDQSFYERYARCLPVFMARYGEIVDGACLRVSNDLLLCGSQLIASIQQLPRTFTHGDCHFKNVIIPENSEKNNYHYAFIDWQEAQFATPMKDIAALMVNASRLESAAENELRLLALYHKRFIFAAKLDKQDDYYDFANFIKIYRCYMLKYWMNLIVEYIEFDTSNEIDNAKIIRSYVAVANRLLGGKEFADILQALKPIH